MSKLCFGVTDVFIANNTPYNLKYRVVYTGKNKKLTRDKHYHIHGDEINSWDHAKVLSFNRFRVPRHSTHLFSVHVQFIKDGKPVGKEIILNHNLEKKRVMSHVAYGVDGSFYSRKGVKRIGSSPVQRKKGALKIDNRYVDVLYQDVTKNGAFHNVEYAFTLQPYENSKFDKMPTRLRVYHHNVFMRPRIIFRHDGQVERAKRIPREIAGAKPFKPDVVTFNEVFEKRALRHLVRNMEKEGYVHHTQVLAANSAKIINVAFSTIKSLFTKKNKRKYPTLSNGGVVVFSRWSIQKVDEITFGKELSSGFDSLVDKGCLYVRVEKLGVTYNIFATHMNVGDKKVQEGQLKVIKTFIGKQSIPKHEPIIIAGDMNICKVDPDSKDLYEKMLRILNVELPECRGYPYTFARGGRNILCNNQDLNSLYLDYIFFEKDHRFPKTAYSEVLNERMKYGPWINRSNHIYYKARWELSDHYPVYCYLEFEG